MPSIIEVDTIKNKTGTQNTVLSTDGSGNNTLNAGVIKSNTGSNTGLTIASDGQITVNQNNPTIQLGTNTTFPTGNIINVYTTAYNGGTASLGGNHTGYTEMSTNVRFSYTPVSANSKFIVSYNSTKAYVAVGAGISYWAIGHEVTASDGTATASTLVSQMVSVGGDTDTDAFIQWGIGGTGTNRYDPLYLEVIHSPSYSLGQKIWYTVVSAASTWHYLTNNGDVKFKVIEIKG